MNDMNKKDRTEDGFVESTDNAWIERLEMNAKGKIAETWENYDLILENDPALKNLIYYDEMQDRCMISREPAWSVWPAWNDLKSASYPRPFRNKDYTGYLDYLRYKYGIAKATIYARQAKDALIDHIRYVNPVQQYLEGLEPWDGTPRVETLFVDYMGAEDMDYTRAVTKCILVAAVARTYEPGIQFDNMLILKGAHGIGKSTIIWKLAKEKWCIEERLKFAGNPGRRIQGGWLIDVINLDNMDRSAFSECKSFLSRQGDRFYRGKYYDNHPRRCVFFGTTSANRFLIDRTGNRRYWTVPVDISKATKSIWNDLDGEVDQIWAEAVKLYRDGTHIYFPADMEQKAQQIQDDYVVKDSRR